MEQQGLQLSQYLRLVGKEQDVFQDEMRVQAEAQIRRSLALDAFADAEQIQVGDQSDDANTSRERLALARLVELATSDGKAPAVSASNVEEKPFEVAQTSDTEGQAPEEERRTE